MNNQLNYYSTYSDGQLVSISGPDSTTLTYLYDAQQRAFYLRDAVITSGKHGATHVGQDMVPPATCTTPGLMSSTDKCKLDSIIGTRLGVLGFQGSGFPDDGGWMQGDIILAAGSELISLERVGNVIRFVVDMPSPFLCASEECVQIYWIQDSSDSGYAIRPPAAGGTLPDVNLYGELKVYLFPESTAINPSTPNATLNRKDSYPSLIFKRYDNGVDAGKGQMELVLARNGSGTSTVGWAFTPGTGTALGTCVWFMGLDAAGNRIDFQFSPRTESNLLGAILYKGASITKQMAVITGYSPDVLSTNQYKAKWWSISDQAPVGTEFTITNLQQWDLTNNNIVLDSQQGNILVAGQMVDVWTVNCGAGSCYWCKETPNLNVNGLWNTLGAVEFGNTLVARAEDDSQSSPTATFTDAANIDTTQWGMTNIDDPMVVHIDDTKVAPADGTGANYMVNTVVTLNPAGIDSRHIEIVDDSLTGNIQRPVHLWHRTDLRNALIELHLARPTSASSGIAYPPIDVLMRAPLSSVDSRYVQVVESGTYTSGAFDGLNWVRVSGLPWNMLPAKGTLKVVVGTGVYTYGQLVTYSAKLMAPAAAAGQVVLVTSDTAPLAGVVLEVLNEEYNAPVARLGFRHNTNGHGIEMTATVGLLDLDTTYASDAAGTGDDFVRGITGGVSSATYWQNGATTTGSGVTSSVDGFYVLSGGIAQNTEYYNILRLMVIENQVWVWWNDLLIPTVGGSPYFTMPSTTAKYGKFGVRLWPGAKLRRMVVRSKLFAFSEFTLGQLELS